MSRSVYIVYFLHPSFVFLSVLFLVTCKLYCSLKVTAILPKETDNRRVPYTYTHALIHYTYTHTQRFGRQTKY